MLEDLREKPSFPSDFVWGTATAACQIEGARGDAARGESIWDRFCASSGLRDTPALACDHYHRYEEDVELLSRLGVGAYRFSLAWPRIMPLGKGKPDREGLAFYDRLIEAILNAGIDPFVTLYHGDLPQPLQDHGGWPNRDTARYFGDFTAVCTEHFADRVRQWVTINDPWQSAFLGHYEGTIAPGIRDFRAAWAALHHLLLAHAEGIAIIRDVGGGAVGVGISVGITPVYAAGSGTEEEQARSCYDAYVNRSVLDPIFRGAYPEEITELLRTPLPDVRPGDLHRIAAPLDFLGVNYYTCRRVTSRGARGPIPVTVLKPDGECTATGWEIHPAGLRETLDRLSSDYEAPAIYLTENGAAFKDAAGDDGRIRDHARISYLEGHLRELLTAITEGLPVKGYFLWSLLDGFQWQYGYSAPFGLVAVDRNTNFARTPKESFDFFAAVIDTNAIP